MVKMKMPEKPAAKNSLLHYFKPKPIEKDVGIPSSSDVAEEAEEVANEEAGTNTIVSEVKPDPDEPNEEPEPDPEVDVEVSNRRPTRASASRARQAWNGGDPQISSSDEDEDFQQGNRKRLRSSCSSSKRSRQATLTSTGKIVNPTNESNNSKKKVKLDPEREAFLRSGVPDVIKKAKKSLENKVNKGTEDDVIDLEQEHVRRPLNAETLAFLHSGVPDSISRARETVDKRREQDELLETLGFFPKTSHICSAMKDLVENIPTQSENTKHPFLIKSCLVEEEENKTDSLAADPTFSCFSSQDSGVFVPVRFCCDCDDDDAQLSQEIRKSRSSQKEDKKFEDNEASRRPWIDVMKVNNVKNLVVDKKALETLTRWVKQWKMDIKDDGGTSRKLEKKKRRGNSSDSDFVTSDEADSEMKKKSVLLAGPSGCGKTTAVYVLAQHYGFEVVEVNFSSRRPGKEVLQRVEEAVLSHRLESSQNCLLLFKDIDLLHPDEDEGFFAAVAQLITTALRPIVMTTCLPVYCLIDSKLDRKDPLRISFTLPKASKIVENVLKPILTSENTNMKLPVKSVQVDKWLDSIVRHAGCDIRQSINQLQLLLSTSASISPRVSSLSNDIIHLYSGAFQPHLVDLNFPRQNMGTPSAPSCESSQQDDDDINLSGKARNKRSLRQLDSLSQSLEIFADLDCISSLPSSCPTQNINVFGDIDEAIWHWNHMSGVRNPFFARLSKHLEMQTMSSKPEDTMIPKWMRELVLESDEEIDSWLEIEGINEEIGQYCEWSRSAAGVEWESYATVRTIVKNNLVGSAIGRVQKRNGRMATYFNRIDRNLVNKIAKSFGFQEQLESVKILA